MPSEKGSPTFLLECAAILSFLHVLGLTCHAWESPWSLTGAPMLETRRASQFCSGGAALRTQVPGLSPGPGCMIVFLKNEALPSVPKSHPSSGVGADFPTGSHEGRTHIQVAKGVTWGTEFPHFMIL